MTISVLLADDHAIVREGLRLLLATAKLEIEVVGEASDGQAAVRKAKRLHPHIAVVDIAMPKLTGIAVVERISENCPSTRSIILSMYSAEDYIWQALSAGARGYVLKEAAGGELIDAIREVHAGRHFLSPKVGGLVLDKYIKHTHGEPSIDNPLDRLSPRERVVLELVVEGKSSAEIGSAIMLSRKTVETYRSRMMHKLDIHDLPTLTKFAIKHGLTPLE